MGGLEKYFGSAASSDYAELGASVSLYNRTAGLIAKYYSLGEIDPDTRHADALATVADYDRRRGSELLRTLESFLSYRGIVATARALFIHPNTLRQRLDRIEQLTGVDVARTGGIP